MWQIAKQILDSKTQSRIVFISKIEELENYLAKEVNIFNFNKLFFIYNKKDKSRSYYF